MNKDLPYKGLVGLLPVVILLSVQISCNSEGLTPAEYARYITAMENGLLQEKVVGNLTFRVQYKPVEYVTLLETGPGNLNRKKYAEELEKFKGFVYFTFSIIEGPQAVTQTDSLKSLLAEFMAFEMENHFSLSMNDSTGRPALYHLEQTGLGGKHNILLGFEAGDWEKPKGRPSALILSYNDRLFGAGQLDFQFHSDLIRQIPSLKI